ncbi:hypothetical protein JX266_000461 [Neoarthrinium moseri]|nr:hypothetical protein JX266_000461 [Neoarthrinium moseri]
MKAKVVWFMLLSGLEAVVAIAPRCEAPASSCQAVPASSSQICSSIIAARATSFVTCEAARETITSFSTITETPIITLTTVAQNAVVTSSNTVTLTVIVPPTHTDTAVLWNTASTTVVLASTETNIGTTTVTVTSVKTNTAATTIISRSTSTSTVSWAPETCPTAVKRSGRCRGVAIPRDCSCFLTSTVSSQPTSTELLTVTATAAVQTVPYTATPTDAASRIDVTLTIVESVAASAPTQTVTSTTTTTFTETAVATTTITVTLTASADATALVNQTATATTVAATTRTEDPCDATNVSKYLVAGIPSNANVVWGFRGDGFNDLGNCCFNCNINSDCAYWRLSNDGSICETYFVRFNTPAEGCTTTRCSRGHPVLAISPGNDGWTYGMGFCGNFGSTWMG